jgi:hypothetical protein|tara:strand:+ start:3171 stop:6611 length:3441 start_codon:yes stop_codon:yes gene_type:complete
MGQAQAQQVYELAGTGESKRFSNLFDRLPPSTEAPMQSEENSWFDKTASFLSQIGQDAKEGLIESRGDKPFNTVQEILDLPNQLFQKHLERIGDARTTHLNQITDNNYEPNKNTLKDHLDSNYAFQATLGFADTQEEIEKALRQHLAPMPDGSPREFKIIKDERKDKPFYMPTYYTSVETDEGDFTKYSNPLQDITEYVARLAPQTLYALTSGSVEVGTAATTAAASGMLMSAVFPPAAPVVAGTVFLTSLYANAVSSERVREEFVKGKLGLTDEDSVVWMDFVKKIGEVQKNHPVVNFGKSLGGYEITPTAKNAQEEFAGYVSAYGTPLFRIFDRLGLLGDRLRRQQMDIEELENLPEAYIDGKGKLIKKGKDGKLPDDAEVYMKGGMKVPLFKQVVQAAADRRMFLPGGEFGYLNKPFDQFMLATFTPMKFIERISKLAQQTSLILPSRLKKQSKQLVDIAMAYAKGDPVNYADFRAPYLELRNAYKNMGDAMKKNYDPLARQIGGLDNLFGSLRLLDAKLKYNEVFKTIGSASYDLAPLQKSLVSILDKRKYAAGTKKVDGEDGKVTVISVTDPNAKSYDLDKIISELQMLGKDSEAGPRMLNARQATLAKNQFLDSNSEFLPDELAKELVRPDAITPANMLHGYAIILNQLIYSPKMAGDAKAGVRAEAKELRKTLLDMLGNPVTNKTFTEEKKKQITPLLKEANAFYRETFELRGKQLNSSSDLQRIRDEIANGGDPGTVLNDILGDGAGVPPKRGKITALKSIKAQVDYINERGDELIKNVSDFDYMNKLFDETGAVSDAFKNMRKEFHSYLYRAIGYNIGIRKTDPKNETAFVTFFDKIDDDVLELLGLTKDKQKYFLETAEDYANMFDDNFMNALKDAVPEQQTYDFIDQMFKGNNFDTQLRRLIYPQEDLLPTSLVGAQGVVKKKIRDAIFQYMFDPRGNAGALRRQSRNTAYFDANEHYIDIEALSNIVDKIQTSKVLREQEIFSESDMKFLKGVKNLGMALEGSTKTDAGIALSGAQIFSDVVEVWNLYKFFGAMARIATQNRISNVLADPKTVNFIAGINENKPKGFLRRAFLGRGALGDILMEFSLVTPERTKTEEEIQEQNENYNASGSRRFENLFERIVPENEQTERLLNR